MRRFTHFFGLLAGIALAGLPALPAAIAASPDPNSVGTIHLKKNAVTSNRIKNRTIRTQDIRNGAITYAKLAEDAVFTRTLIVSPVGPTAKDNCEDLRAALDSISENGFANRYLIHMEPGLYDCGDQAIVMKPFVDIQGSGQINTILFGTNGGAEGVVTLASFTELRNLTVVHQGNEGENFDNVAVAIGLPQNTPTDAWSLSELTAKASNGTEFTAALRLASNSSCGNGSLRHITAEANTNSTSTGLRIGCNDGVVTAIGSTFLSTDPGFTKSGTGKFVVRDSVIEGQTRSVRVADTGILHVINSQLIGNIGNESGDSSAVRCVGIYDENLDPIDASVCVEND